MSAVFEHVTCLGCGVACDDVAVTVGEGRIAEARNACALGREWFGDGAVPAAALSGGQSVTLDQALDAAAGLLRQARRVLVYIGPDLSVAAQQVAVQLADVLTAFADSPTSAHAESVLAAQRRGRAGATLGEIARRADLLVFWGVNPAERSPRYLPRFAQGPGQRTVAVDVGTQQGPPEAHERFSVAAADEVDVLNAVRAGLGGRIAGDSAPLRAAAQLADRMRQARYVVLVSDGEDAGGDPDRPEALIALAQALNGPTRGALSTIRSGGNRVGADHVMTWQTGFPIAVDFAPGYPRYRPREGALGLIERGEIDAALVAGSATRVPSAVLRGLGTAPLVLIGPRASEWTPHPRIAVDTGIAGIHEAGMAFRMDDVPLPLTAVLEGPPMTTRVLSMLGERLGT